MHAPSIAAVDALAAIDAWPARNTAAGVARADTVVARHGAATHAFRWASVTKLATAYAVLVSVEE